MRSININLTSKCNASCEHCCFSCSPSSKEEISEKEIDLLLHKVLNDEEVKQISLTGGEALLRKKLVLDIIQRSHEAGKTVTLITNGFWAANDRCTNKMLDELVNSGLDALTISYDKYHSKFIPVENIQRILKVGKRLKLYISINIVTDKRYKISNIIDDLGTEVFGIPITIMPVSDVGNAKNIDCNNLYYEKFDDISLKCPASSWEFTIHHDGNVYPCCSPAVFESNLNFGNIRKESIEDIENNILTSGILFILQKEGLSWFIDHYNIDISELQITSICDLCRYIFSDNFDLNDIYSDIKQYYENIM